MGLRNIWDGLQSLFAAAVTVVIGFIPAWFAHQAVSVGVAPQWVYAPIAGLIIIAGLMTIAFLRKALTGVAPLRDRQRR